MKKIHIIYNRFYDSNGIELKIGGVETYLKNIINLYKKDEAKFYVYQYALCDFEIQYENAIIIGVRSVKKRKNQEIDYSRYDLLIDRAEKNADINNDILIFGADFCIDKNHFKKTVAIQHGIGWDYLVADDLDSYKIKVKFFTRNILMAFGKIRKYKLCDKIVCVDYNFLNWYRTFALNGDRKLMVIPNFSSGPEFEEHNKNEVASIIFARRFETYRGTRVMAKAVENLLSTGERINVCFAGEGPDERWLHNMFDKYDCVKFDKFHPNESIEYHKKYDIAVVPSTASEGTSLSLLEAMAAGCAVICSDVGGLTNIVIDNYNGIMIRATEENLTKALRKLCNDKELRNILSKNGYETVSQSFSLERWKSKWRELLDNI